jgi:hypothetical protein
VLGLLDIRSISVNILIVPTITVAITVRALVRIGVGRAGRLVALEQAGGGVARVLLALHQLSESWNAGSHAERAEAEIGLRGTFDILRST